MVHQLGEEVVALRSIATALPPFVLEQEDVAERVRAMFSKSAVVQRLMPVFQTTGIRRRYSCVPIDWYYKPQNWTSRNAAYLESAERLLEQAARAALERAGIGPAELGAVVTVSTTGIATPSLEARLLNRLGFPPDIARLPIFGLGCVGGAVGLARAAMMARAMLGKPVLLLVTELCALWFRKDDLGKSNVVATALFGDGAAAAVVQSDVAGPRITASGEHTFPNTLDIMGWDVADDGLRAIFSRDIPHLVQTQLRPALDAYLAKSQLSRADIDVYLSHPGGTKVLDALEHAFGIDPGSLKDSRAVLADFGNMSAVTVLFVIERALREGELSGSDWNRALVSAMGPGFTAAFVTLER